MDTKKVLQHLLKIADKQQQIITKLAQGLPPDSLPTSQVGMTGGHGMGQSSEPPPQDLDPNKPQHVELQKKVLSVNPKLATVVASLTYGAPGTVNVAFKPGQKTQANYDAVRAAVQAAGVKANVHVV